MSATDNLSPEDKEFLAKCEEEFKDRYTDKDEEFMKVFNAEKSVPPIIKSWISNNSGRRNDRRSNRRFHPYDHHNRDRDNNRRDYHGGRDQDRRGSYDRRSDYDRRGYNDYRSYDNRGGGFRHRQ